MKKIALVSALMLTLAACSVPNISKLLAPTPAPTLMPSATNTIYVTSTDTPTITDTLPTPTYTGTPTLIGGGFTLTPTFTEIPATATPTPAASGSPTISLSEPGALLTTPYIGFSLIRISGSSIKWGGCEPSSITFTARVSDPANETGVLLFFRLSSPNTGEQTSWEGGANMISDKSGNFTYTATPKNISHIDEYSNGWLQYQLKALNAEKKIVGYTQPYLNNITVTKCTKADFGPPPTVTETPVKPTPTLSQ